MDHHKPRRQQYYRPSTILHMMPSGRRCWTSGSLELSANSKHSLRLDLGAFPACPSFPFHASRYLGQSWLVTVQIRRPMRTTTMIVVIMTTTMMAIFHPRHPAVQPRYALKVRLSPTVKLAARCLLPAQAAPYPARRSATQRAAHKMRDAIWPAQPHPPYLRLHRLWHALSLALLLVRCIRNVQFTMLSRPSLDARCHGPARDRHIRGDRV